MKEKLKKQLAAIFSKLKLTEKASAGEMTQEDWNNVFESYQERIRNRSSCRHANGRTGEVAST